MKLIAINSVKLGRFSYVEAGEIFEIEDKKEAERLIEIGTARKAGKNEKVKTEKETTSDSQDPQDFTKLKGIGEEMANALQEMGYTTYEELSEADPEEVAEVPGISLKGAKAYIRAAKKLSE